MVKVPLARSRRRDLTPDPEAGSLAYRLPRAVLSAREGRLRLDAKELPRCPPKVADPIALDELVRSILTLVTRRTVDPLYDLLALY